MTTIPSDILQSAEAAYTASLHDSMAGKVDYLKHVGLAILAERERIFVTIQAAYRRGVDFACEGAGVVDDDYLELWKYVPKAAYDYADKATAPTPPVSSPNATEDHHHD